MSQPSNGKQQSKPRENYEREMQRVREHIRHLTTRSPHNRETLLRYYHALGTPPPEWLEAEQEHAQALEELRQVFAAELDRMRRRQLKLYLLFLFAALAVVVGLSFIS